MARLADWPTRLDAVIISARAHEFAYGQFDCVKFVAECVEAQTGIDHYQPWNGLYNSKETAYSLLPKPDDLCESMRMMMVHLNYPECHPNFAKRGDVVMIDIHGIKACGIHLGRYVAMVTHQGIAMMPTKHIICAWSI
jgi:hypothetical protein